MYVFLKLFFFLLVLRLRAFSRAVETEERCVHDDVNENENEDNEDGDGFPSCESAFYIVESYCAKSV